MSKPPVKRETQLYKPRKVEVVVEEAAQAKEISEEQLRAWQELLPAHAEPPNDLTTAAERNSWWARAAMLYKAGYPYTFANDADTAAAKSVLKAISADAQQPPRRCDGVP